MDKVFDLFGEKNAIVKLVDEDKAPSVSAIISGTKSGIYRAYLKGGELSEDFLIGVLEPKGEDMFLQKAIRPDIMKKLMTANGAYILHCLGEKRKMVSTSGELEGGGEIETNADPQDERVQAVALEANIVTPLEGGAAGQTEQEDEEPLKEPDFPNLTRADFIKDEGNVADLKKAPQTAECDFQKRFMTPYGVSWSGPYEGGNPNLDRRIGNILSKKEIDQSGGVYIGEDVSAVYVASAGDILKFPQPFLKKFAKSTYLPSRIRGERGCFMLIYSKKNQNFVK